MACSGARVCQNALDHITEMKLAKDNDQRLRILEFGFCTSGDTNHIDVVKKITQEDLAGQDAFNYMRDNLFKEKQCTYVLYDCHYETKDTGSKKELVFIMWCHENSKLKDKMSFASSKETLKNKMDGTKHFLEITEMGDISSKKVFAEALGKSMIAMEGETI